MAENYWISLLQLVFIFIATTIIIGAGHDQRGSKRFQKKFPLKNKLAQKVIIFKPIDNKEISILEFFPYVVSGINVLILFPVHIVYWISKYEFLSKFLKGDFYKIYSIIILAIIYLFILIIRTIDMILGEKERRRKYGRNYNSKR